MMLGEPVGELLGEPTVLALPACALSRRLLPMVTPTGLEPVFSP